MTDADYFERSKEQLKAERDSMVQKIKNDIAESKRKAISKA